jgi:predicted TIM-barrel fold metal-dependent hydrolase
MKLDPKTVPAIDLHCHYVPDAYRKALEDASRLQLDTFPLPQWNVEQQIEVMDRLKVQAAVLSLSSPDISWGDDETARRLARDANEVAAEAVRTYPKRLGFYATLPMPDVDASLSEIEYAFDVLDADGVKFYSNSNGVYLGDPKFEPVFEELNRRRAVVTMHPVQPKVAPNNVLVGFRHPWLEFMFDTTRALANMIFNGTFLRNPDVKFVCPHLGTLFPLLAGRMQGTAQLMVHYQVAEEGFAVPDVWSQLGNLYYDTAGGFNLTVQIPAVLGIGRLDRMVCGLDSPFTPPAVCGQLLDALRSTDQLDEEQIVGVLRGNALDLFPRFGLAT